MDGYVRTRLGIRLYEEDIENFAIFFKDNYSQYFETKIRNLNVENFGNKCVISFEELYPYAYDTYVHVTLHVEEDPYLEFSFDERIPSEWLSVIVKRIRGIFSLYFEMRDEFSLTLMFISNISEVPEIKDGRRAFGLFSYNLLPIYILMYVALIAVFFLNPNLLVATYVGLQLIILFFSDKILLMFSDWKIESAQNVIQVVELKMNYKSLNVAMQAPSEAIRSFKREIHEPAYRERRLIAVEDVLRALEKYKNLFPSIKDIRVKNFDIGEIVGKLSRRFGIKPPKIGIVNSTIPNAAAAGISPRRSVLLLTAGLFSILNETEIEGVLGHELSHIKNRDPLLLMLLFSGEYALRFFLFTTIPAFSFFWLPYFVIILSFLFFVAKFFEARADLEAIYKIERPEALVHALMKFAKRIRARGSQRGALQWFGFDPHPPLAFRIERLSEYIRKGLPQVRHLLLKSIVDVVNGFLRDLFSQRRE